MSNACQSPIERHLLFALLVAGFGSGFGVRGRERGHVWDWGYPLGGGLATLAIEPQAHLGDYQVDLMVELEDYGHGCWAKATLVVECDGHEFHEKTTQQARRDKGRDRVLQACGFAVFHFTGSEIWQDAFRCAESILHFLTTRVEETLTAWRTESTDEGPDQHPHNGNGTPRPPTRH